MLPTGYGRLGRAACIAFGWRCCTEEWKNPCEGAAKGMIVGRPNVGKSALFNRLTRKWEVLVYDKPDAHVTRDVREGIARLGDMRFIVADTAGLETDAETDNLLARTAGLTTTALSNCQIALYLLDGDGEGQALTKLALFHMFPRGHSKDSARISVMGRQQPS